MGTRCYDLVGNDQRVFPNTISKHIAFKTITASDAIDGKANFSHGANRQHRNAAITRHMRALMALCDQGKIQAPHLLASEQHAIDWLTLADNEQHRKWHVGRFAHIPNANNSLAGVTITPLLTHGGLLLQAPKHNTVPAITNASGDWVVRSRQQVLLQAVNAASEEMVWPTCNSVPMKT